MQPFYRQITAATASMPLAGGRVAARGLRQAALRTPMAAAASRSATATAAATAPLAPTCQCGSARFASTGTRRSPTVQTARRNTARRRVPLLQQPPQQQQQAPDQAGSRGGASGGPMSGSIFPDDLSTLLPALEAATEMVGDLLTDDEFIHVISSASQMIEARRPASEAEIASTYNITPYQMHIAAVFLLCGNNAVPKHIPCLFIALTLMHLATASIRQPGGYLPSTLTIVNMITAQWPHSAAHAEALRKTTFYRNAERQFLAYLTNQSSGAVEAPSPSPSPSSSADNDDEADASDASADLSLQADAFTLAGVLAEGAGEPQRALQWYLAAREVGNASIAEDDEDDEGEEEGEGDADTVPGDTEPREIRWNWEQRCLEGIGRLHLAEMKQAEQKAGSRGAPDLTQTEQHREAKAALRTAALALGSGKAGLWLATDYASDDDTSEDLDTMLYRAAVHAIPGTYDALAKREATKAAVLHGLNSSKVTDDATFHQMLAEEWQMLAEASKSV